MCTYSEKYKESLILFSHAVIDPGTVVIHLPDASFTNTAGRREKTLMYGTLTLLKSSIKLLLYTQNVLTQMFQKGEVWAQHGGVKEHVTIYFCIKLVTTITTIDLQWCALSGLMLQHLGHL